jgi:hypothetical protein
MVWRDRIRDCAQIVALESIVRVLDRAGSMSDPRPPPTASSSGRLTAFRASHRFGSRRERDGES